MGWHVGALSDEYMDGFSGTEFCSIVGKVLILGQILLPQYMSKGITS